MSIWPCAIYRLYNTQTHTYTHALPLGPYTRLGQPALLHKGNLPWEHQFPRLPVQDGVPRLS